ncbi:putative odorant receptor 85d [Sitodiplosis mosellana]|uniref:putative odorant receptor 85d n=1 Tax=Sitodiplosis mosellana TaxID=263140 RepID=UPI002444F312|nr:putative odorant receptor 85d [Sitodiplosis mosellana]
MQSIGMFFTLGMKIKKIKALHLKLQEIVDNEDPDDESYTIYSEAEQKCRKYTQIIWYYFILHELLWPFAFLYPFYCIYKGQHDTSKWFLPFSLWVPFSTESIFGWYLMWFIQFNMSIVYITVILSATAYFVSCAVYIIAICDHFELQFKSLKEDENKNRNQSSRQHQIKIKKAIDIHVNVYEVFRILAEINSGVIFSLLPGSALFLALTMFNTENSNIDALLIVWCTVCITGSLLWPFLFCKFATIATNKIHNIGLLTHSDWFTYPLDLQKSMILIIARSQEPIHFSGLNLFYCNVEVFGKIIKTSCSYYLIFRSVTEH